MTQEFSITARNHGTGIAQERLDGVAGRGCLPFVTVESAGVQDDLSDFLLRRTSPESVEGSQHSSQPCALQTGQARVRWNRAAMQSREESANGLDPVEAVEIQRHDSDGDRALFNGAVKDLEILPVTESEAVFCTGIAYRRMKATPGCDRAVLNAVTKIHRGFGQNDNARVFLWKPEDRGIRGWCQGVDGEIAIPTAAGLDPSAW